MTITKMGNGSAKKTRRTEYTKGVPAQFITTDGNLKRAVRRLNRMAPTEMAAQMTIARVHSQVLTYLTAIGRLITTTGRLFSHSPEFLFGNSPSTIKTANPRREGTPSFEKAILRRW